MPKKMPAEKQFHDSVKYEIEMGRNEVFQALPEWVQKKINACVEWNTAPKALAKPQVNHQPASESDEPESDDVPF